MDYVDAEILRIIVSEDDKMEHEIVGISQTRNGRVTGGSIARRLEWLADEQYLEKIWVDADQQAWPHHPSWKRRLAELRGRRAWHGSAGCVLDTFCDGLGDGCGSDRWIWVLVLDSVRDVDRGHGRCHHRTWARAMNQQLQFTIAFGLMWLFVGIGCLPSESEEPVKHSSRLCTNRSKKMRQAVRNRMQQQRQERAQETLCDEWNDRYHYPPAQAVEVTLDSGEKKLTATRSIAWTLCGTAVVMVEGISGGYALERVKPVV